MSDASPNVTNNTAAGRFEIRGEQGSSFLKYHVEGDALDLVHTEVPAALEGKGYGKALVEAALAHARAEGLKIIPTCPFVRHYLEGHPEAAALVARR
jgi:predicted GNAT family acetyltransferase